MSDIAIELGSLSFAYPDGRQALSAIDLRVARGEKVAVVGPNGAGKSTLFLHLNGILRGQGRICVAGVELNDKAVRAVRARVGLVFQDPDDQLFSPTVFEDVAFGPLHLDYPRDEVQERVTRALAAVGMSGHEEQMPHHMSLGERKRIAIATVLAALGQLVFLQNIGMFDVYTAHMNADVISCAALLAGGASIKSAKIRHALIGVFLFHTLFIVSPQAGQNLFHNAALGEYFRSFVAYGTIAFALIVNIKHEDKRLVVSPPL